MRNTAPGRVRLSVAKARELVGSVLAKIGYDSEEARIISDHVIDAALCGYEYSGLPKLLEVAEHPRLREPRKPMRPLRETTGSTLFDGGNNTGLVTVYHATHAAIAKAHEHGFGIVGITNSWVSGRSAHYVEMIARANLVGILTVSSTRHVAPPGGTRPAIGTNPIAFGFPTLREPVIVDLGTSAFMSSEVMFRERRGELLPEGVAIDAEGRPTRDPTAARRGSVLPFGGYKGFALGFALHALGILAGSGFDAEQSYGYLIIAMKPDLLVPLDEFRLHLSELVARVKATPRQPGVEEIRIPSERAFRERARNLRDGIEIDRAIYESLQAIAGGDGAMTHYKHPFV